MQDNAPLAHADRAVAWFSAVQRNFASPDGTSLYREHHPAEAADGRYADEWPFSQIHIGVLDLAAVPGAIGEAHRNALARHRVAQMLYWMEHSANGRSGFLSRVVPPHGTGGDLYYDDNEWVGLAAVQHWAFFKDEESLTLAKRIFELVRSGWDDNPHHPAAGGVFWTQWKANSDRNTVSNMPAAQLGLRLYEITRDKTYLDDALRFYAWTNKTLRRPDGLYVDHIDLHGRIDERIFSYNQGVPVAVNVLLYRATGDSHYLDEAKRIAAASFEHFVSAKRIDRQPPPFNAIYFKNLLLLEAVTGETRYRDAMRDYADRMWSRYRDTSTGLLVLPAKRDRRTRLIDQAAMVQIEAVLAWNPSDYPRLY